VLIPVLDSQPAGDVSHKPGGMLPLLSTRPTVKRVCVCVCVCACVRACVPVNIKRHCRGTLHSHFSSLKPVIIKLMKRGLKKECFKVVGGMSAATVRP